MPEPLSDLERRILDYIVDYLRRHTYQPSIREIGRRFDIKSTKTVSEYLQALARKGWIERDPSRSRGVRLLGLELQPDVVSVPVYATLDASIVARGARSDGKPLLLDRKLAGGAGAYFVTAPEVDSNGIPAGVRAGDLLLVEPIAEADVEDGDVTVVRLGGDILVRTYRREGDEVLLEAGDRSEPVRILDRTGFAVLGRVLGVYRRFRDPSDVSLAGAEAGVSAAEV